jgi:hypothetical protein
MIMIYSEHLYKLNHYIFFVWLLTFRYKIYDLTSGNSTLFVFLFFFKCRH